MPKDQDVGIEAANPSVSRIRPTGPNVVALFSHLDQWGTFRPTFLGASTKSPWCTGARGANSHAGA